MWRKALSILSSVRSSGFRNAPAQEGLKAERRTEKMQFAFDAAGWQTCALALLSSVLIEIAAADGQPAATRIAVSIGIQAVLVAAAHVGCRRWAQLRSSDAAPAEILIPVIIALGLLPFVIDAVARFGFQTGWAFELTLLAFIRNVVLALAAASVWPTYQRTATGLSVLLAIFASSVGNDRAMVVLLALYAVVGMWWLMGVYWGRLQNHLQASHERTLPRRWLVLVPVVVLGLALTIASQAPTQTTLAMAGISPTSGGTRWHDEFARGGVGDGDALVKGTQDASSFGPVESDLFLDSQESSLYDTFSDTYGEPVKKAKLSRAVALPPSLVKDAQERMAKAKQANREFSTVRQMNPQRRELADVETPALLAIAGRGPLHVRLETFDLFDGESWFPTEASEHTSSLIRLLPREGKSWIAVDDVAPTNEIYDSGEQHVVKVINLKTDRMPLPINAMAFHIDRVDQPGFFKWAQEGVLKFDSEEGVPPLTVMHTFSRVVDESRLRRLSEMDFAPRSERLAPVLADDDSQQLALVAEQWAGHLPRDWSRVEAVVARLRSEFVHVSARGDLSSRSRESSEGDHESPRSDDLGYAEQHDGRDVSSIAAFVLKDKRGPDYLFASTACLMLRSLGYSTRLASGFYADPAKYDAKRRHIPVGKEDVHFWCEVFLGARTWVPIEPTPGYELLAPPLSLAARLMLLAKTVALWCVARAGELAAGIGVVAILWRRRWWLADRVYQAWWKSRALPVRERVLVAHRLLLLRSRWSGSPKPESMSARQWYARGPLHRSSAATRDKLLVVSAVDGRPAEEAMANEGDLKMEAAATLRSFADRKATIGDCELLERWSRCVDWACFAPVSQELSAEAATLSDEVLKRWSLTRLRTAR